MNSSWVEDGPGGYDALQSGRDGGERCGETGLLPQISLPQLLRNEGQAFALQLATLLFHHQFLFIGTPFTYEVNVVTAIVTGTHDTPSILSSVRWLPPVTKPSWDPWERGYTCYVDCVTISLSSLVYTAFHVSLGRVQSFSRVEKSILPSPSTSHIKVCRQ